MKVITGDRGTGKTTMLIEESAKTGAYIVVAHRRLARFVSDMARGKNLRIPYPITFDEFLSGLPGRASGRDFHVLIDDVNLLLDHLARWMPIDGITVYTDPNSYFHLEKK